VHDASTPTGDAAVLVDADLAILGAEPGAYSAYSTAIRTEYRHLDDAVWRRGRSAVLAGFLARATIYTTPSAQAWWESRARLNLLAELSVTSGV
jgi:predicted metal-dependent HD superfamily phosphohydrolase